MCVCEAKTGGYVDLAPMGVCVCADSKKEIVL